MDLADPLCHARRRIGKSHRRRADTFDQHEPADFFGISAGVEKRYRSSHRVADEFATRAAERTDDAIEIENIIGEMIVAAVANPPALAMAAAIRRDDPKRSRS